MFFKPLITASLICAAATLAVAQAPAQTVRIRGVIQDADASSLTVKARSGEVVKLAINDKLVVSEVFPIELSDIKPGSYIGTAAMPMADGTLRSMGVTVFPEAMRGTGDGHRPFDLGADSTMTNATVADLVAVPEGRKLQLKYKDGEKTVLVPPGTQIVSFKPADRSLLVTGATVSLTAQEINGTPTATRITAGRNGFAAPY